MGKNVLMKLSKLPSRIDFFLAHKEIIDKYGYVDFARISKGRIFSGYICENTIFIKESKTQGNRIFKATTDKEIDVGEKYPEYYKGMELRNPQWIRLTSLEVVNYELFMEEYHLLNGKNLDGTFRGSVPWVFVTKE